MQRQDVAVLQQRLRDLAEQVHQMEAVLEAGELAAEKQLEENRGLAATVRRQVCDKQLALFGACAGICFAPHYFGCCNWGGVFTEEGFPRAECHRCVTVAGSSAAGSRAHQSAPPVAAGGSQSADASACTCPSLRPAPAASCAATLVSC